jgi:hypothetical protein
MVGLSTSHDVACDVFAYIMKDAGFHVLWEQTHFFGHLFFSLFVGGSTLFCRLMAFTCWSMSSLLTHSSILGIMSGYFLWGGYDNDGSSERRTLL